MILMRKSHLGLGMGLGMMAGAAASTLSVGDMNTRTNPLGTASTSAVQKTLKNAIAYSA